MRILADDLTGACDVGAALLPWPGGVVVQPFSEQPSMPAGARGTTLWVLNTHSRTVDVPEAKARVQRALTRDGDVPRDLVLKKIDTGLRGPLGAELDATMDAIGAAEAFVLPAIPEIQRVTRDGRQYIAGVPVDQTPFARDPQNPVRDAHVGNVIESTSRRRAGSIDLVAVRDPARFAASVDAARAAGRVILVCDAETDADLDLAVQGILQRPDRPLLLAGSIGLAQAWRRAVQPPVARRNATPRVKADGVGVLVVVGSAHPTAHGQLATALASPQVRTFDVATLDEAAAAGRAAEAWMRGDHVAVLAVPATVIDGGSAGLLTAMRKAASAVLARTTPRGLVIVGGETAFHVLEGIGHPPLSIEARLAPLVVRSRILAGPWAGMPLVTKGGSSGSPELLTEMIRQVQRGGRAG